MIEKPVIIVTGAAQGIGNAIVEKLASTWQVVAVDNNCEAVEKSRQRFEKLGLNVDFQVMDIGFPDVIEQIIEHIAIKYQRLDAIINNAAIAKMIPIEEITNEEFDRIVNVNLKAVFWFAKSARKLLIAAKSAVIINIASTRALMSEINNEAYSATKAGMLGLTHALANSLGPNIRVNAICPGWINVSQNENELRLIDHEQHPVGRVGRPQDIVAAVEFLLSDSASFITGQSIIIDGGMTKKMIYAE